jgi:DNA-binding CsgD family transcriptional regulator
MLDALVQGKTDKEIAAALGISPKTVSFHLVNLYRKLGVPNRRAAREATRRLQQTGKSARK